MKKLLIFGLLATSLFVGDVSAAPSIRSGTNCVDVQVAAECTDVGVAVAVNVTNCGKGSDTIDLVGDVLDQNGNLLYTETAKARLKPGKASGISVEVPLPSSVPAGVYTLNVEGTATLGTGSDSASVSMSLPCK